MSQVSGELEFIVTIVLPIPKTGAGQSVGVA